jgi:hypothetical protein
MQSLIPNPLHPAVVHIPVALAVLLPLFVLGSLWLIRRGARPRAAWGVTIGLMALLSGSAWLAVQTGEQQEERVEAVVPEQSIHSHEEAADLFVAVSAAVLVVALAGLARGRIGQAGRWLAAAGTAAILVTGWRVGHTGGMLVYRDGAAAAYAAGTTDPADPATNQPRANPGGESGRERSESRRDRDDR